MLKLACQIQKINAQTIIGDNMSRSKKNMPHLASSNTDESDMTGQAQSGLSLFFLNLQYLDSVKSKDKTQSANVLTLGTGGRWWRGGGGTACTP